MKPDFQHFPAAIMAASCARAFFSIGIHQFRLGEGKGVDLKAPRFLKHIRPLKKTVEADVGTIWSFNIAMENHHC
jgi:hypothetical protein